MAKKLFLLRVHWLQQIVRRKRLLKMLRAFVAEGAVVVEAKETRKLLQSRKI
jgi:hypothetical protein